MALLNLGERVPDVFICDPPPAFQHTMFRGALRDVDNFRSRHAIHATRNFLPTDFRISFHR